MAAEPGPVHRVARTPFDLFRLWALYARMDVLWIGRAGSTAFMWYFADFIVGTSVIASTWLLAERFDGIGSWSKAQVLFLLGYSLVVRGLVECVFGWNVSHISRRIGRGQLDHMLLQPRPLWMIVLTEGFSPVTGSGMLVAGSVVLAHATGEAVSPDWLHFGINLTASVVVVIAFSYAWGSVAFLAPRSAEEINSSTMNLVDQLRGFPLDGLAGPLRVTLLSVLPVGLVAWLPSRALLGLDPSPVAPWLTPGLACMLAGVAGWIFNRGLHHYGRTGSTRYLAHGHRR
jgi:ABC-2 type transport system permease protein